jgi:hypothetical protein
MANIDACIIQGDPWQSLANAIMVQACEDYRTVCEMVKLKPRSKQWREERRKLLEFFKSEYCSLLSKVDVDVLIEKINKDMEGRK